MSERFTKTGAVQYYVAPETGLYEITVEGAQGGGGTGWKWSDAGGKGAVVSSEFELTANQTFVVVVGGKGGHGSYYGGGGGGGSFVFEEITSNDWVRMISAGGGGGAGYNSPGGPGQADAAGHAGYDGGGAGGGFDKPGGGGGFYGGGGGGYSGGTATGGYYGYIGYAGYGIGSATFKGGHGYQQAGGGGFGGGGGGSFGGGGGGGFAGGGGGAKPGLSLNSGGGGGGGSYDAGADPAGDNGVHTGNGDVIFQFICFARGTRITTPVGELPVEAIDAGDCVTLAAGGRARVKWVGHFSVDCERLADPAAAWPVRISAGALGDGLPKRDLWLSRRHALLIDGALIPVEKLINGVTIVQEPRRSVQYWHVELDAHEAILAEGLPCESYLDCGNRATFANSKVVDLRPSFEPTRTDGVLWPYVESGPTLVRARQRILARALGLGYRSTADGDPHIIADGARIEPIRLGPARLAFTLPAGCERVVLASRTFAPAQMDVQSEDRRELGLSIGRLQIDGEDVPLGDPDRFDASWRAAEGEGAWRWTGGAANLKPDARVIVVDLAGDGQYWEGAGGAPAEAVAGLGSRS